jgi:hypothetical protein
MIGTGGALVTAELTSLMPAGSAAGQLALAAGLVGTSAFLVALAASRWLPEPGRRELPD